MGGSTQANVEVVTPSVLVVDDEREVADTYAIGLREYYDVETAYGGTEALEAVEDETDVVLLDRRMPDLSGDEVLREIRERGLDCRVIIVTAVDPGFDIIDMPFDDYLCKPVNREDLVTAVDHQLRILAYDSLSEYFELVSTRAVLDAELPAQKRDASEEYTTVDDRLSELEPVLRGLLDDFDEVVEAFGTVDRGA